MEVFYDDVWAFIILGIIVWFLRTAQTTQAK